MIQFYIVATPIGNLKDITLRAIEILKSVDLIYAEDTRVSSKLLRQYQINTKTYSYNDLANDKLRQQILNLIKNENKTIALISDAGTPLISDPGYKLVNFLKNNNVTISTIPGACSPISALVASGLPTNNFYFAGFIPQKKTDIFIQNLFSINSTLICFESPKRLQKTIELLTKHISIDKIIIARELSKLYEEIIPAQTIYKRDNIKGEIVIIIDNNSKALECDLTKYNNIIEKLNKHYDKKTTANLISNISGINKKQIYEQLIKNSEKFQ